MPNIVASPGVKVFSPISALRLQEVTGGCGWESQDDHVDTEQKVQKRLFFFFFHPAAQDKLSPPFIGHVEARRRGTIGR